MKIPVFKLYPLSVVAMAMSFYLLATGHTGWYLYVLLGFIALERTLVAFLMYVSGQIAKVALARMMTQANAQGGPQRFTPGELPPMTGGSIEPPE
jgi:hypothetical protein